MSWTIRYKAILLLTVFAANFFVVCHCSARATIHSSCCTQASCCSRKGSGSSSRDGKECSGMHAVKFNLLEKQVAKKVSPGPAMVAVIIHIPQLPPQPLRTSAFFRGLHAKHPPPDYQSLYQCFLI